MRTLSLLGEQHVDRGDAAADVPTTLMWSCRISDPATAGRGPRHLLLIPTVDASLRGHNSLLMLWPPQFSLLISTVKSSAGAKLSLVISPVKPSSDEA